MLFLAALARLEAVGSEISGTVQARDVEAEPAAIAYVQKANRPCSILIK